jgi:malonyl-CoA/methylmalonyl-CoA synthetase
MVPSPHADLHSLLAATARSCAERSALEFADAAGGRVVWSYAQLFERARRLSTALAARGVGGGDRVALVVGNRPEFVVLALAILRTGAALLPIHVGYRPREIAHLLADARPRLVIAGEEESERVAAALDELPAASRGAVESMLSLDEIRRLAAGESESSEAKGADATGDDSTGAVATDAAADDLAILLYTSGTTGRSKGAMLSNGNVRAMIASLHEAWEWRADDALYLALPLFHLHGLVVGLFSALAAGATVHLEERFDAVRAIDALAAGRATLFFGVPTLYRRLVEELGQRDRPARFDGVRLFVSGSAPLPPETFAAFRALTGRDVLERYGMSETGMLASNPLHGERRAGTVGRPLPGVELRLTDEHGDLVAPGAEGEVEARGPNVFDGYWGAPEKTAESFRVDARGRRWFRTGDLGRIDPEGGYLTLLGRRSELILSGGFNVYPRELEEVLLVLPGVREAAVVGEPHPEFGQSPVAFLVVDREIAVRELDEHCRSQLAAFKRPRRFVVVDQLPRNALGKVEKRRLLEPGGIGTLSAPS